MKNAGRVRNEPSPSVQLLKDSGIGALIGLILCIIFSLVAAFVVSSADLPHRSVMPISIAIIGISSFVGSIISGKIHKRQGLVIGALTGAIMLAVILVAGFFVPDESAASTMLLKALVTLAPSLVGSVIGVNLRRKY